MKPPGSKRLSVVLSAVAYVLLDIEKAAANAQHRASLLPVALQLVVAVPPGSKWPYALEAGPLLEFVQAALAQTTHSRVQLSAAVTTSSSCSQTDSSQAPCLDLSALPTELISSSLLQQRQVDDWLADQQQQHFKQQNVLAAHGGSSAGAGIPGQYTVFLLPAAAADDGSHSNTAHSRDAAKLVVGRYRHAWITYQPQQAADNPQYLLDLSAAATAQALDCCFAKHSGNSAVAEAADLPISAAGHTHLSFSLLNANPSADSAAAGVSHYSWDFSHVEDQYLSEAIRTLSPVCHVSTESRVLHYTPARIQGKWSRKHNAYVVKHSQLPFFIDSEWAIESGRAPINNSNTSARGSATAAPAASSDVRQPKSAAAFESNHDQSAVLEPHVLHFLVYIPPADQQPLLLLGPKGRVQDSNSFWIPSWGGLVVLNNNTSDADDGLQQHRYQQTAESDHPSLHADVDEFKSSTDLQDCSNTSSWQPAAALSDDQYRYVAVVVLAQLQALFGVAAAAGDSSSQATGSSRRGTGISVVQLPAGVPGFAGWQVDALVRQRTASDVVESCRVLAGFSKLVQELPNLEMPDLIGQQVRDALQQIELAWQHISAGDYHAAGAAAAAARASSEAAFLHPAVLAHLNFPDSHKLGVYMPLFLPVAVPLLQGLAGQLVHYVKRWRECSRHQR